MDEQLKTGRTALITGAASGIGAEVAKRLDEQGFHLILSGSNQEKLKQFSHTLRAQPDLIVADLCQAESVARVCQQIRDLDDGLDVAFFNAGMIEIGEFSDREASAIDRELDLNLRSVLHLVNACLPNMKQNKSGHIIVTSSLGGIMAMKGNSVYSATKFALRGFLSALQQELIKDNIKVSGIYPGGIDTDMLRYEAINNGSALNFLNEPKSVDDVADVFMKALKTGRLENYVPYSDGVLSRLVSLVPGLIPRIMPFFERKGEQGRQKFIRSRKLDQKS